jgi:hypothetical protein
MNDEEKAGVIAKATTDMARIRRTMPARTRADLEKYLPAKSEHLRAGFLAEIQAYEDLLNSLPDAEVGKLRDPNEALRTDLHSRIYEACFPYIKIPDLVDGAVYEIHARNAHVGVWREAQKGFEIPRHKFDNTYLFIEYHWDWDRLHGTVKPYARLADLPDGMEADREALLAHLDALSVEVAKDPPPRRTA